MAFQLNQHDRRAIAQSDIPPVTNQVHRTARIWNKVADRYAEKPVADEEAYARKLAITREYLHPTAQVIELGCGTGSTALAHAPYVRHIRATDVSSRMIEIARSKGNTAGIANVDFECLDVNDVLLPDACVDVVLMLNVLHVLTDWRQHIEMSYRILKPGGVLVTSTMCMSDDFNFLRIPLTAGRIVGLVPQLSFFTRDELEQAFGDAGFKLQHASEPERKKASFLVSRKPS